MKAHLTLLYSITTLSLSQAQEIISTQGDSYSNTAGTNDMVTLTILNTSRLDFSSTIYMVEKNPKSLMKASKL